MTDKEQIKELADFIFDYTEPAVLGASDVAEIIYDAGYHKTIWHKVAEGDLPKNDSLVLAFYKPGYYSTKLYLKNADGEGWWYGTSDCKTEDIIAWTELPEYKG